MPSFCAMPSELVRQHPKRNIPPQQTSIQHMLLLALSLSCISLPGCQQSWEMCITTLWVCAHACPRLWKKCRVLWGTDGKEHTQCDSRYAYVSRCARAYVCVCLCVRGATLLERARVPKVTRRHSGKRSLLYCLYVQKQTTVVEPCHWLVYTYRQHVWKSKDSLPNLRAKFN